MILKDIRIKNGNKRKFNELMTKSEVITAELKNTQQNILDINSETANLVLKQLEKFEIGFLEYFKLMVEKKY